MKTTNSIGAFSNQYNKSRGVKRRLTSIKQKMPETNSFIKKFSLYCMPSDVT